MSSVYSNVESPRAIRLQERKTIVLVDDSEDSVWGLAELLKCDGHEVLTATNAMDGLKLIIKHHANVAIIDLGMPAMDGYTMSQAVRAAFGKDLVLIAHSGYGGIETRHKCKEAGFDYHLLKPIAVDELGPCLKGQPTNAKL